MWHQNLNKLLKNCSSNFIKSLEHKRLFGDTILSKKSSKRLVRSILGDGLHATSSCNFLRIPLPVSDVGIRHLRLQSSVSFQQSTQNSAKNNSHLFTPVLIKADDSSFNEGEFLSGPIERSDVLTILSKFYTDTIIKESVREYGLDDYLYREAYMSFRHYCEASKALPTELHIILTDILKGTGHIHNILPVFLEHARKVFPHLLCMEDLCKVSDLTNPPNWYPDARDLKRKIIFHSGPTNSGKTFHAMQSFLNAKSGIYCSPLKLLAVEVFRKSNEKGTPCDLVTGEERKFARDDNTPSSHMACTAEMTPVSQKYDVAIIDEIQLLRDSTRGWAWTRALLGLVAREIHVCGEAAAIPLVQQLAEITGDELEIMKYKRLTNLTIEDKALGSLAAVQPGDCIVCFSKRDIISVSRAIEKMGHQVAVIYGGLPPGTKLAQAQKFNDPSHPCKIMVATDAIGMGLNLSIRRVVFNSVFKTNTTEGGKKEFGSLSVSQALQIAGRAGRFGTQYEHGFVTTMLDKDLLHLKNLLRSPPEEIEQAGLHPTPDQIELFAYHLPSYNLSNLIDIFISVCTLNKSLYFMCPLDDFKFLADMTQHISLPLRSRYVFCCAPINKKLTFVCAMFLKYVRQYSNIRPATVSWLCSEIGLPLSPPSTIAQLVHLEEVFDVCDLYLWLSYRFSDMFPDREEVRGLQVDLDRLIQEGVDRITELSEMAPSGNEEYSDREAYNPEPSGMRYIPPSYERRDSRQHKSVHVSHSPQQQQTSRKSSKKKPKVGRGKLADHLVAQGYLTKDTLAELQKEWMKTMEKEKDSKHSRNRRKGR